MTEVVKITNVCYSTQNGREIFNDLSLVVGNEKVGIVGRNGVGKTTLLSLITNQLTPTSGMIELRGRYAYVPQIIDYSEKNLGSIIEDIRGGIISNTNNSCHRSILKGFKLGEYDKADSFGQLSGGEARLILILHAFLSAGEVVILDEPESDLDYENRRRLRELIKNTQKTVLIVSHDQKTLSFVNTIIEIKEQGVEAFGGNFCFYLLEKEKQNAAIDKRIRIVSDELNQIECMRNKVVNSQEYRMMQGREEAFDRGYGDFWCDTPKKDRAAKTLKKLKAKHDKKTDEGKRILEQYLNSARIVNNIKIPFEEIETDKDKTLVAIHSLYFGYDEKVDIIRDFCLEIHEGEKIWLFGRNGVGKTTLLNIIGGKLTKIRGEIRVLCRDHIFCEQRQEEIDDESSLMETICKSNDCMSEERAKDIIQASGFPLAIAERKLRTLSGGERIIATLIVSLSSKKPPRLLILDEPTNHLDMHGIQQLQIILKNYNGAIIIATHDEHLMESVGGFRRVPINNQTK